MGTVFGVCNKCKKAYCTCNKNSDSSSARELADTIINNLSSCFDSFDSSSDSSCCDSSSDSGSSCCE